MSSEPLEGQTPAGQEVLEGGRSSEPAEAFHGSSGEHNGHSPISAELVTANSVNVESHYFDKRDIVIGSDEVVVVACMRNEIERLVYFLKYYRKLGVRRFLLVDNNSTDETEEYLRAQPDVEYFKTSTSYRGSSAGRLWLQELADTYAVDRWVLTVDVDELLFYPGIEAMNLRDLGAYLDDNDYRGLFTVMLDMYSDRPLAQTVYRPGTDFLQTCPYFEVDTYRFMPAMFPPFINIHGGPRGRLFDTTGKKGPGPAMKKVPLVKWHRGFSYVYSTHSHRDVPLADITGLLLHFKFFASFNQVAATEAIRGDRRQHKDYRTYLNTVDEDLCFYGTQSLRYGGASEFVRMGVMSSTNQYAEFVGDRPGVTTPGGIPPEDLVDALLPQPSEVTGTSLRAMATVWPLVNNPLVPSYFTQDEFIHQEGTVPGHRAEFVQSMRKHVRVLDVATDHLVLKLDEVALHRWERSGLAVAIFVGDQAVDTVLIDGSDPALQVAVDSLEPGVFRLAAGIEEAAEGQLDDGSATVTVYLIDGTDEARLDARADGGRAHPKDALIHSFPWYPGGISATESERFHAGLTDLRESYLRGWCYDALTDRFDVPVNIYINGRIARQTTPTELRSDLDRLRRRPTGRGGRGFRRDLPLSYFEQNGERSVTIEARIAGTNISLSRSPISLNAGVHDAHWNKNVEAWVAGKPEPAGSTVAAKQRPRRPSLKRKIKKVLRPAVVFARRWPWASSAIDRVRDLIGRVS